MKKDLKDLNELTENEHKVLKNVGILKYAYPKSSGNYQKDCLFPNPISNIEWNKIIVACDCYLKNIRTEDEREDNDHLIFELVLETIYGKTIWEYING